MTFCGATRAVYTRIIGEKREVNSSYEATDSAESLLDAMLTSRWMLQKLGDLRNLESQSNPTD
jgi:hypothetical protein